uniref:hemerythrin domain-containing protein n=1 Tax=uncultured Draconibacterium sp. TaxID=1573823 RepID=UPI003217D272
MKRATENLENDHVYILRLTEVILAMVKQQSANVEHFKSIIGLIRNFADGTHHKKEEDLLFPIMGKKGFSPEQGPVAVMLHEHEEGRKYVSKAAKGIQELEAGNSVALQAIYNNLSEYALLLQQHIDKENNVLFRMADQVLSSDEQQGLLVQFLEIEGSTNLEFNSEVSILKIDKLVAIYLS